MATLIGGDGVQPAAIPTVELASGAEMPRLGLGTYQIGDLRTVVDEALRIGYRHFDVAASYVNERDLGAAIAEAGVPRDELFVTTKLATEDHGDRTRGAFLESLERLGLAYVDLYLIHWPSPSRGLYVDTWRVVEELFDRGLARAIGVSNFEPEHLLELRDAGCRPPMVNQIELHPYFQQPELRAVNDELGIVTQSWSPLGRGAVLDDPVLRDIASDHDVTIAQVVIRWHLQLGLATVPKASSSSRLIDNISVLDFELTEVEIGRIERLDRGVRRGPDPHTS